MAFFSGLFRFFLEAFRCFFKAPAREGLNPSAGEGTANREAIEPPKKSDFEHPRKEKDTHRKKKKEKKNKQGKIRENKEEQRKIKKNKLKN